MLVVLNLYEINGDIDKVRFVCKIFVIVECIYIYGFVGKIMYLDEWFWDVI